MDIVDIGNIQLALFGIAMTLFTVIYSFIINKRDELKLRIGDATEDKSPSLRQKISFLKNGLESLKAVNSELVKLIALTFILFVFALILSELDPELKVKHFGTLILKAALFLELIYIVILLKKIFTHYQKSTKV